MVAYGARFAGKEFHDDYISLQNTQPIKGIFILLVLVSHFVQYVTLTGTWDAPYFEVRKFLGQLVVVPFLFFSGYGIVESITRKNIEYVKALPGQRILKVLLQFDLAVMLYVLLRYVKGKVFPFSHILLSLTGWKSVGNSNWYIFTILVLYFVTYLSYVTFRKNRLLPLLSTTFLATLYIIYICNYSGQDKCWGNTAMAYVAGMWYSHTKQFWKNNIMSNNKTYF